ncbi:hypothetical protein C8Q76DRAFT_716170 [Earliella scabrosa]|nr:hypothetical protein C8Q76DRAFT_716170 [Earliella scabrosa]
MISHPRSRPFKEYRLLDAARASHPGHDRVPLLIRCSIHNAVPGGQRYCVAGNSVVW